jgi:prevent-host-death family protein
MERSRVGIRDLRQNLSVYVERVLTGEVFEVTDRGTPVALLGPLPEASTPLARLIREGRATAPVGDLLELGLPEGEPTTDASDALQELREDRL